MAHPEYPRRPPFFAAKFVRAMIKTCVANEHGQGVFTLLACIAHTEDASHYRRPVTFYEGQLMPVIGIMSRTTFYRVRQRAIDSGWLVCVPGGRGMPPSYFVQIPEHATGLDDAPSDEGDEWAGWEGWEESQSTPNHVQKLDTTADESRLSPEPVPKIGRETGLKRDSSGTETGLKRGAFIPVPIPNPVPKEPPLPPEGGSVAKATKKNAITSLDGIAVPEPLNTPEHRSVLGQWLAYRVEVGKPYRAASAVQSLLAFWAKHPDQLAEAVRTSMANQWQGLFVPDPSRRGRAGPPPAGPGQKFEGEKPAGVGEF